MRLPCLPAVVSTDSRYERLSTDRSDCRLSFAAPVGLMLSCNHLFNQYLFIEDSEENLSQRQRPSDAILFCSVRCEGSERRSFLLPALRRAPKDSLFCPVRYAGLRKTMFLARPIIIDH